ncbi:MULTISPECIES: nucleotidyltransferase domain-containing protein [Sporomusa]|uniref:Nucleotidyltransferase domain protein n=2 Tax=Sporomusa TaxID=2375 RepID=A0ABM9W980_9FIRM|nr:nucleotidyltransferase domain-containing protein [Sporomusa sphaeroides]OLS54727.1 nucleotidyltransferase domain protein [Sporomusa sphaeroides DSM 2875]CVK20885.1 Nucleotidyltransferase domain protein [Sporomusa sphaeroides DSM 2875]SCM82904.1 putative nucleotidyltransferase [uncultured Sporomusa sp.]
MAVAKDKREYVNAIMNEIVYSMKDIFGSKLRQVILFGSYARGEQEEDSDMDIMVLVDLNDSELNQYNNVIAEVITDISIKYGVLPSIIDKNYEHFHHWVPFLPFYRNVKTEGVEFYAS